MSASRACNASGEGCWGVSGLRLLLRASAPCPYKCELRLYTQTTFAHECMSSHGAFGRQVVALDLTPPYLHESCSWGRGCLRGSHHREAYCSMQPSPNCPTPVYITSRCVEWTSTCPCWRGCSGAKRPNGSWAHAHIEPRVSR